MLEGADFKRLSNMDTALVQCAHCGAKNRIPHDKQGTAKCGRCHQPLTQTSQTILTLRCSQCHTKNRVPVSKLNEEAKCGRCHAPLDIKDVNTGRTILVSDANFNQSVLQSPLPVLLYAWAPWCSVCGSTTPMVEQLAPETKGKIRVAKLNVDANPNLANRYNIMSVPAFFIFDAGQLKHHIPGAIPKHELMLKMAAYI